MAERAIKAVQDARAVADRLEAGGEPRMANIIRRVCRSNDSYRGTLKTLHRDNMELRKFEYVEALDTDGFMRELCRNACAEVGDPPCYEIDPENWQAGTDPDGEWRCTCRHIVETGLRHIGPAQKPERPNG